MVRLGEHDLTSSSDNARPQDFRIAGRRSPGYNRRTHENDIEVLILDADVAFNGEFLRAWDTVAPLSEAQRIRMDLL